jgi:hypothetical protein
MSNDFELLIRSYLGEVQALDTAATELLVLVSIDGATGVQLDGLGQIIGAERQGLDDDDYRMLLRAQIQVNKSGGTIPQLIEIIRLASNTTLEQAAVELTESFPADFVVKITVALDPGTGDIAAQTMYEAKAAGVHGVLHYFDTEPVFAFDGDGGSKFDGGYYLKTAVRNRGARESELL